MTDDVELALLALGSYVCTEEARRAFVEEVHDSVGWIRDASRPLPGAEHRARLEALQGAAAKLEQALGRLPAEDEGLLQGEWITLQVERQLPAHLHDPERVLKLQRDSGMLREVAQRLLEQVSLRPGPDAQLPRGVAFHVAGIYRARLGVEPSPKPQGPFVRVLGVIFERWFGIEEGAAPRAARAVLRPAGGRR